MYEYSLACMSFESHTGQAPSRKRRDDQASIAHVGEPRPTACDKREGRPAASDGVIAKGMGKTPEERYPTCTAFFEAASETLAEAS